MPDDPYFTMADVPDGARVGVLALANALDCDDEPVVRASDFEDLPDGLDHDLPLGPETRFGTAVEWLTRLEGTDVDPVPVLERLWEVACEDAGGSLTETEDVLRAFGRETALVRANERKKDGRPSKVEAHAETILAATDRLADIDDATVAERNERLAMLTGRRTSVAEMHMRGTNDLRERVADAATDLSRRSWYRLRRRVLDSGGPDINEFDVRKNLD